MRICHGTEGGRNTTHIQQLTLQPSAGIKAKVENKGQYEEYLKELESVRDEMGVNLKEVMYPEAA